MNRVLAVAAALALLPAAASAQWFYDAQVSAFTDTALHIGATTGGAYTFGLRCESPDDLTAVYFTPEFMSARDADGISVLRPELLVRIDDGEPLRLRAATDVFEGRVGFLAYPEPALAHALAAASGRVAVAVSVVGEVVHEQEFTAVGSTSVMTSVITGCGLPD